eukprot:TRINITY_DN10394_c0_g1_i1.p1 TRINITY_DN10394_c0_g1~~TRINITY_DN10394_c0_g1_i1.p1  ORF type:complete len:191 (+),score=9.99 TRINITY_DN10394_c0_g1_i1:56-628(+)
MGLLASIEKKPERIERPVSELIAENHLYNATLGIVLVPHEILALIAAGLPPLHRVRLFLACKHWYGVHLQRCEGMRPPRLRVYVPPLLAMDDETHRVPVSQCAFFLNNDTQPDLHTFFICVRILDSQMDQNCPKQCCFLQMTIDSKRLFKFQKEWTFFRGKKVQVGLLALNAYGGKMEWFGEYQLVPLAT